MSTEQDKEIATIKGRNFCIELSDADVERLFNKAASVGLTASKLLESFIGDLVYGTYTNGSDERMYAEQWFERCGFSMGSGEKHFLQWLIECGYLESVVNDWNDYLFFRNIEARDEDDTSDMESYEESVRYMFEDYLKSTSAIKGAALESEMQNVMKWHQELQKMKGASVCQG